MYVIGAIFVIGAVVGKSRIVEGAEGLGTIGTAGITPLSASITDLYRGILPFAEISEELDPFWDTVFKPFDRLLDLRDRI